MSFHVFKLHMHTIKKLIIGILYRIQTSHVKTIIYLQIETDDPNELTEEYIYDELHPKKNIATMKFAKPKGPQRKGQRKLLRNTDETE